MNNSKNKFVSLAFFSILIINILIVIFPIQKEDFLDSEEFAAEILILRDQGPEIASSRTKADVILLFSTFS